MFNFLRRLFSTRSAPATAALDEPAAPVAPGTSIHYDPHLVERLIRDHRRLEVLFGEIVEATRDQDERRLARLLTDFGDTLRDHLLTENVRFYVYLQHDPKHAPVVQGFQREMRVIGRALMDFMFRHSKCEQWSEAAWQALAKELDELGQVLNRRIVTEEASLYPLYQPPKS